MNDATASAPPLAGISSMATRRVLADLALAYARAGGPPVALEAVGGVDAARRVRDGERFDFVVLAAGALDTLAATGRIVAASRVDIARSGIAIAVREGDARPDIGSEAAVRDALLHARSIGVSTGPSGTYLTHLLARWGVADTVAARVVQAPPGTPVGTLIAKGDVALGFQQTSELLDVPGIAIVGPLPPAIQETTIFAGAVCSASSQPAAAAAALAYFASPAAAAAKRRHGMEPA